MKTNKAILLIEDNPSDVELTKRALKRGRIANELVVAENGEEALAYLMGDGSEAGRASALPLSHCSTSSCPKSPGCELLRRIRADARTRRLPVVILTTSIEEQDLAASYDLGVNSYIRKPVDFNQFAR